MELPRVSEVSGEAGIEKPVRRPGSTRGFCGAVEVGGGQHREPAAPAHEDAVGPVAQLRGACYGDNDVAGAAFQSRQLNRCRESEKIWSVPGSVGILVGARRLPRERQFFWVVGHRYPHAARPAEDRPFH